MTANARNAQLSGSVEGAFLVVSSGVIAVVGFAIVVRYGGTAIWYWLCGALVVPVMVCGGRTGQID